MISVHIILESTVNQRFNYEIIIIIILMLQPGSSLDYPIDISALQPVRCLGGSSVLIPYTLHLLGFLDENCFPG